MRKTLLLSASLLALGAGRAGASGINLGWNDCPGGSTYALVETFACNTNDGFHTLVGSFVTPAGVVAMSANEIVIDVQTGQSLASAWWSMRGTNPLGCRTTSLLQSGDFTAGPSTCLDYWQGGQSGGISEDVLYGNRARIKLLEALPAGSPLITSVPEGAEVYSFKAVIKNLMTVGLGACGGCSDEACIVLGHIRINQPVGIGNFITITNAATVQHAIWQAWTTPDPAQQCPQVTPAKRQTWGSIKALYR